MKKFLSVPMFLCIFSGCFAEANDDDASTEADLKASCTRAAAKRAQAAFDQAIDLATQREQALRTSGWGSAGADPPAYACIDGNPAPPLSEIAGAARAATIACAPFAARFATRAAAEPVRRALRGNLDFRATIARVGPQTTSASSFEGLEAALAGSELYGFNPTFADLGPSSYLQLEVGGHGSLRASKIQRGDRTWETHPVTWRLSRASAPPRVLVTDGAKTSPYDLTLVGTGSAASFVLVPDEASLPSFYALPPACPSSP